VSSQGNIGRNPFGKILFTRFAAPAQCHGEVNMPLMKFLRKYLGQERRAEETGENVVINDHPPWFDRDSASSRIIGK